MSLLVRINLVVGATMLLGLLASGFWLYRLEMRQAREMVVHEAELMLETAQAVRAYTVEQIATAMALEPGKPFMPQTVPSFAAQRTLEILQRHYPDYTYREVAMNPTNLDDLPADWEVQIIRDLRGDPTRSYVSGARATADGTIHFLARAIRIEDQACLECHGDPADAPPAMRAVYGSVNGFGWTMGEVIGAQIVAVPMAGPYAQARETFTTTILTQIALFTLAAIAINLMVMRLFRRPLLLLADYAERRSLGAAPAADPPAFDTAELETLRRALLRLSRSVAKAVAMLERRPTGGG